MVALKQQKRNYLFWLVFLIIVYFAVPVLISFDSAWYHKYVAILKGELPWQEWDFARGVTIPFTIYMAHIVGGYSSQGILLASFPFFWVTLYGLGFFNKYSYKGISFWMFLFLIVLNPIVISYYHFILPEYFGITFAAILFYLINSKRTLSLYTLFLMSVLVFLSHQAKQSFSIFLFPVVFLYLILQQGSVAKKLTGLILFSSSFVLLNNSVDDWLRSKIGELQVTRGTKILYEGVGYGLAKASVFDDVDRRSDAIILEMTKLELAKKPESPPAVIETCARFEDYDLQLKLIGDRRVLCRFPRTILEAVKIHVFFLKNYPTEMINSYVLNLGEMFTFIPNRYHELHNLGFFIFDLSERQETSNIMDLGIPSYESYAAPYLVNSKDSVGFFGWWADKSKQFYLFAFPWTCLAGFIVLGLFWGRLSLASKCLGFGSLFYVLFAAGISLLVDRYSLLVYPFLVTIICEFLNFRRVKK